MNSCDRVLAALFLEEPDKVPFHDLICNPSTLEGISGKKGLRVTGNPKQYLKVHRTLHLDMVAVYEDGLYRQQRIVAPNVEQDEWRIKYRVREDAFSGFYLGGPIRNEEDLETFEPPDPYAPSRFDTARAVVKLAEGQVAVGGTIIGPFTHAWMLTGMDRFLRSLYTNPSLPARLIRTASTYYREIGKQFIEIGAPIIIILDDYGHKDGPFLSPEMFRRFVFPTLKEMVNCFQKRHAGIFLHSDGNLNLIMDDLVEMGIQCINPIERKAGMDLEGMKQKYGERICLSGNVDATRVLHEGTLDEIDEVVKGCFRTAAPGGGYIFGSDAGEIPPHVTPERAKFMFDRALKYRTYSR